MGAARGRPGGAPPAWVWGVRARALSQPQLPALLGGLPGPTTHWLWVRGAAGVGTRHQPHGACSCELALRAVGAACGCPGGHRLPGCGASGVGRSPTPDCPPSGRAAGAHYPLAVGAGGLRAWGPVTNPTARALSSWLCALWGRHEGARGGAPPAWVWGVRGRALSHPRLPALWAGCRGPLPTGCGCGGVRAWGPVTNPTARALASWLYALWGRHEGAWGGASCLGRGRPGSGALPPPTARPLGGLPGPITQWLWVRGGAGVGTRHQPDSARSFELALRAVGAARREGRGRLLPGCGASGVGRSPTPDCPPSGRAPGAHYPLAVGAGGCGRGDPSPTPQRALLRAGFARCGGGMRVPGGAPLAWVWGVRGRALSHPRLPALSAGCRGPLPTGCGCGGTAGVGTRQQPHSARSSKLALRAVGAA